MEVFKSLPEGTLVQLMENELIMSPAPLDRHQKLLSDLHLLIGSHVKQHQLGNCRLAPYDVYFDDENVLQPDFVFLSNERLHLIQEDGLHGAPDLVVEILSPSSAKFDKGKKKTIYERFGVKEYWIVDPATKEVQGYRLKDNVFAEFENTVGVIRSSLLGAEFVF